MTNYHTLLFLLLLCLSTSVGAQQSTIEPSLKYGKPTEEELLLQSYLPDTTAAAVVLYRNRDVFYEFIDNDFRLNYSYEGKIKILKPEGTAYADISIPYFQSTKPGSNNKETVVQIDASAYNMVDGKVERIRMKKEFIFRERLNDSYMQVKFTIPGVKVGSVIEYKYKILSDNYSEIKRWNAQEEIPVLYTSYSVAIPEYFSFSVDTKGVEPVKSNEQKTNINMLGGVQCSGQSLSFVGRNVDAFRGDSYVWCPSNYITHVDLELNSINFANFFKSYTQTWDNIDELLLKYDNFGEQLKLRNPLKEDTELLKLLTYKSVDDKICALYGMVKGKIAWNGKYELYGGNSKKALKEGTADNAEINFILMSVLRDAGFKCFPVVMSRRNQEALPYSHPSIQKLNTFVVAIATTDSTMAYIDASVSDGYLNVLPPVLCVDRARIIYGNNGGSNWVDLSNLGKNKLQSSVIGEITPDGVIKGTRSTKYDGQYAATLKRKYREAVDSTEFVKQLADRENVEINNFKLEQVDAFSPEVREVVGFEKKTPTAGDYIYLNPLVFLHTEKNPMVQSERKLPVEFDHTEQIILSVNLMLPEGYQLEEKPQPLTVMTEDGESSCKYNITVKDRRLIVQYRFNSNRLVYLPNEYQGLQAFWETIAGKNNETIVLKKI